MNNTTSYVLTAPVGWIGFSAIIHTFAALANLTFVMVALVDRNGLAGPRLLILNLAVCGSILSVGWYPATTFVAYHWHPDPPRSCSFFAGTIFFVTATNWSEVPIAINRIVAICLPHYYRAFNTRLISFLMIVVSWFVALTLILFIHFNVGAAFVGAPYGACIIRAIRFFGRVYSFIPAVIPFTLVGMASVVLFTTAHLKTRMSNDLPAGSKRLIKRRLNVAKAMLASLLWHVLTALPIVYISYGLPQIILQKPWLSHFTRGCSSLQFAISPVFYLLISNGYRRTLGLYVPCTKVSGDRKVRPMSRAQRTREPTQPEE